MTRATFLRSLLLCAAAPAVVSRALSAASSEPTFTPGPSTIWIAQTEDGRLHGGRMRWSNVQSCFVADKPEPHGIVGLVYFNASPATAANGWGQFAPKPTVYRYGSLRLSRS